MSKYELPDLGSPEKTDVTPQAKKVRAWSRDDLEQWLAAAPLADWARDWLRSLEGKLDETWPDLVAKGLGRKRDVPEWMKTDSANAVWLRRYLDQSDIVREWFEYGFLQNDPAWLTQLLQFERAKVARSFLLSGNISDYAFDPVNGYRPSIRLLVNALMRVKDCVLTYRLSQGLNLHAHKPDEVLRLLPESIQNELKAGGFNPEDPPLLSKVCHLFDVISRWLTGSCQDEAERSSGELQKGIAIIFENVHLIIPSERSDVERNFLVDNLLHWSISPELFNSSHCLILMAESLEDVSNDLRAQGGKIEQISISRPHSASSRLKFILPLLDPGSKMTETRVFRMTQSRRWLQNYDAESQESYIESLIKLSNDTAGLSLIGIEDLLQQASTSPKGGLSRDDVMKLKRERLQQESGGLIEVIDPHKNLNDIGGYEHLKIRLREIINALGSAQDKLVRATIPMGILFLGPPGTGKSIMAEALAGASDINMAKLGDFRGKYVGESERNLSRIFHLIESLHPVIVFIDEIDQAIGKRGDDSGGGGVDRRIFGRFLEFMSNVDHRSKIIWIGAANYPNNIDSAFKRAGRFDLILPFTLPDEKSRADILRKILEGKIAGLSNVSHGIQEADFRMLAAKTEGFTGAELEAIVGEVLRRVAQQKLIKQEPVQIPVEIFEHVLKVYQPPTKSRGDYRQMELLAINEVSFLDLIPEEMWGHFQMGKPCETKVGDTDA